MKTVIEMAIEVGISDLTIGLYQQELERFAELVRADERAMMAEQPAQQQEPVVWMYVNKSTHETKFQKHMSDFVDHSLWSEVPLYGEPLANHELQCVCGAVWCGDEMVHLPDKRPPASKPWVGLTNQELIDLTAIYSGAPLYCAIEAKLKEKNT